MVRRSRAPETRTRTETESGSIGLIGTITTAVTTRIATGLEDTMMTTTAVVAGTIIVDIDLDLDPDPGLLNQLASHRADPRLPSNPLLPADDAPTLHTHAQHHATDQGLGLLTDVHETNHHATNDRAGTIHGGTGTERGIRRHRGIANLDATLNHPEMTMATKNRTTLLPD
jgi:hypothetical protein